MRKASKQVIHSLRGAAKEHPAEQQEGQAAHAVQLLVGGTCQVIANLQEVSLPHDGTGAPTAWPVCSGPRSTGHLNSAQSVLSLNSLHAAARQC